MRAYSFVYATTEFVAWQIRLFHKYLPSLSEFVVVNNGPNHGAIERECSSLGVRCLCVPSSSFTNPSESHANAINHALRVEIADSGEDSLLCDMDIFPIEPTRFEAESDLAGVLQVREAVVRFMMPRVKRTVRYPWPGLLWLRRNLAGLRGVDFQPQVIGGVRCDTGGQLGKYAESNALRVQWLSEHYVTRSDMPADCRSIFRAKFGWKIVNGSWLHYLSGSNWRNHSRKSEEQKAMALLEWLGRIG